jgi:glyoxylase-like metal-dependent hydrolase (beta-lactamase superfamily II)
MLKNSFSFKLGNFECIVVKDGTCKGPMKNNERTSLGDDSRTLELELDVQSILIKTGTHNVLIDTGWGIDTEPDAGNLIYNLQASGVQTKDIDTVIFSHAHPDHIGGNTDVNGKPVFNNACYIMNRKEWEFWASISELTGKEKSVKQTSIAAVNKNLKLIKSRFKLIGSGTEIVPGIGLIETPGHSPGHIVLVISSSTERLLCIGDIFHQPSDIATLDWSVINGKLTEEAISSRKKILSQAVSTKALIFCCHFKFPGLGYITKKGGAWLWQPIEMKSKV